MAVKKEDIRQLSTEELQQRIADDKVRYTKMKFNHTVSAIENPLALNTLRKDIARYSTELRAREIEIANNQNNGGNEKDNK